MSAERPIFSQARDQHDTDRKGKSMLIKRSDGSIEVGTFKGIRVRGSYIVEVSDGEENVGYKPVADEALSDEVQAKLARELGGPLLSEEDAERSETLTKASSSIEHQALGTVGINEPAAAVEQEESEEKRFKRRLDELEEGLDEKDKVALWQHATARHGYESDSAIRKMSLNLQRDRKRLEEARAVWTRLKEIREEPKNQ